MDEMVNTLERLIPDPGEMMSRDHEQDSNFGPMLDGFLAGMLDEAIKPGHEAAVDELRRLIEHYGFRRYAEGHIDGETDVVWEGH